MKGVRPFLAGFIVKGGGVTDGVLKDMMNTVWNEFLSTAGPEKPCWKLGRPRSKAKYDAATDSAEVP